MREEQAKPRGRSGETYRAMLLARRAELLSNLGLKLDGLATIGRVAEEDQAQLYHEQFISLSVNTLEYKQLGLINEALDRIAAGDYGRCLACGELIPARRLRAVPWARHCVPCQEREAETSAEDSDPVVANLQG